jgi:hypothetical protein
MPQTRPPGLGAGLPKFKRLFDFPQDTPTPPGLRDATRRQPPAPGPMSPRANYIQMLKTQNVREPDSIAAQLLQVLQGGGSPLPDARRLMYRALVSAFLGGSHGH